MAGLTALYAIQHGGNLIARPVLITAASGGGGLFACQLATLAGARVVGQVRHASSASLVQEAGADQVVVDENIAATPAFGPYHLILDQLGGRTLAEAMTQLAPGGTCVAISALTGSEVPLDYARVRQIPDTGLDFFANEGGRRDDSLHALRVPLLKKKGAEMPQEMEHPLL